MPCATALQHGSTVYAQSSVRTQQCTLQCTSTRQSSTPSTKSSNVTALSPSPPPGNPHGRGPCSAGVGTVCGVFGARRSSEHLSRESIVSASGCRAVRIYHRASSSRRRQMWKLREKVVVGRVQNDVSGVNLGTPPDVLSQTRVANHFAVAPSVHGHGVPCSSSLVDRAFTLQSTTTRRWKWFARGVNLVRKRCYSKSEMDLHLSFRPNAIRGGLGKKVSVGIQDLWRWLFQMIHLVFIENGAPLSRQR